MKAPLMQVVLQDKLLLPTIQEKSSKEFSVIICQLERIFNTATAINFKATSRKVSGQVKESIDTLRVITILEVSEQGKNMDSAK